MKHELFVCMILCGLLHLFLKTAHHFLWQ